MQDTLPRVSVLDMSGRFDRAALRAKCEALEALGRADRVLVDARCPLDVRTEAQRVQFACFVVVYFFDARVALLASKEDIHHVAESVAVRAGVEFKAFWREEAALEWLRAPLPGADAPADAATAAETGGPAMATAPEARRA